MTRRPCWPPGLTARALAFALACLSLATTGPAPAQLAPAKRPLNHGDYANWRSIQGPQLSPDGAFVAYVLAPQEGDGELVVRNLRTHKEWRHPRGSRQAPQGLAARAAPGRPAPAAAAVRGGVLAFTPDGKSVVFPISPTKAEQDKARKAKPPAAAPHNALGVMDLATGKVTRIERVRGFQVPEEGPAFLVYHVESRPPEPAAPKAEKGPARPKSPRPGPTRAYASDLVLRNLATGKEHTFADVTEYALSKDGRCLVYAVSSRKGEGNGAYAVTPGRDEAPTVLRAGPGRFSRLTWDEKQSQLAFIHDSGEGPGPGPRVWLCHWKRSAGATPVAAAVPMPGGSPTVSGLTALTQLALHAGKGPAAVELAPNGKAGLRPGLEVSEQAALSFSADGGRLFFGVAPPKKAEPKPAADAADEDKVVVELWHWKDDFIQPMQKVRAQRDRQRSYRAVFDLRDRSCRQLTDDGLSDLFVAPAGDWALGSDDRPHRLLVGHDAFYADYYLVGLREGARKLALKKQGWPVTWSPGGRYLVFYDGKDWNSLSVPGGKRTNLTAKLGVKFGREDHDAPGPPPPYGVAGWTAGDKRVLLYDRYDIWALAPDGSDARVLTRGLGRKTKTVLRRVRLDARERALPADRPLLLRGDNEWSRDTGFWRVALDGGEPVRLLSGARNYGVPVKARKADVLMLTVSTFYDPPDLFVTDSSFRELRRVSHANPHKAGLLWGKAELVRFHSADGAPLSGVLIKPENFDPKKKYPMLVYIYERLSDRLHGFVPPRPGTSINPTYYASNGYLVFMPDIAYTVGYPGQSALKCVLPGVQAVVDKGLVNEGAIGIQGHSWGGYQIAYLVTQTTRFKAASAGAPVSNMTSAYGGIRWGSGLPRQFQYERTQSRIGGTLWEYPTRFLENSPVFKADRVKTPLLMLHNDQDEAVPWYQGIEYYLALRRLGKEVYLFNYPGEAHGLRRLANQKDYTVRLQQFFDHHLKGAPKPAWMEKGIPYTPPPAGRPGGGPRRAKE
jgi:dienelactone hydrolase